MEILLNIVKSNGKGSRRSSSVWSQAKEESTAISTFNIAVYVQCTIHIDVIHSFNTIYKQRFPNATWFCSLVIYTHTI